MVIAAICFLVGVAIVALIGIGVFDERDEPEPIPQEDAATPYREALRAAVRMQRAAWEAESEIYAEAARRAARSPASPTAIERVRE